MDWLGRFELFDWKCLELFEFNSVTFFRSGLLTVNSVDFACESERGKFSFRSSCNMR